MNKLSTYAILSLAVMASACQSLPRVYVAETAPAKSAEVRTESKAETKPAADAPSMITPMLERQSTIRATGYAVISTQNHRNAAQQRLMAIRASKLDAYRALTEQVYGQQLDATTTIAEMMVTSDTFRTRVEGVIYGAVLESITPVGDDTYESSVAGQLTALAAAV